MLYYDLNNYQIPEGYTYNSYIKEAVKNIREGNDSEYYKDTLFRMTYPTAVKELTKLSNIDEPTELLPIMSISFMKTLNKFDPENPKVSFMNYYKRTMRNDVIIAYDKHRGSCEEVREYIKKAEKTRASLDELVGINNDDMVPLYELIEDCKAVIDEDILYEEFIDTVFKVIDNMFTKKEQKKKDIFISYINACIEGEKWNQKKTAKEVGTTQSYVSKVTNDYRDVLKERLEGKGYVW